MPNESSFQRCMKSRTNFDSWMKDQPPTDKTPEEFQTFKEKFLRAEEAFNEAKMSWKNPVDDWILDETYVDGVDYFTKERNGQFKSHDFREMVDLVRDNTGMRYYDRWGNKYVSDGNSNRIVISKDCIKYKPSDYYPNILRK